MIAIEFFGFNPEDITIENDNYVPDSDPDSDINVLAVNSDEISNFGDDSGESGTGGEHGTCKLSWLKIFGGINVDEFDTPSGPQLPDEFDIATATPMKYFDLLFPERIFEVLKNNMNWEGLTKEIPIMKTLNGMRPVQMRCGLCLVSWLSWVYSICHKIDYTGTKMSLLEAVA